MKPKPTTPLARTIVSAKLGVYGKQDPKASAEYLDEALVKAESEPASMRFRAYVLRTEIAELLQDTESFNKYVRLAQEVEVEEADWLDLTEEFGRLRELEAVLEKS